MNKKLLTLALIVILMLAMVTTAFAADGNVITIDNSDTSVAHTYEAYQVFSGTVEDNQLTGLAWGSGVDGAAILAELKADGNPFNDAFAAATSAAEVAKVLEAFADNSDDIDAFAAIVGKHLKEAGKVEFSAGEAEGTYDSAEVPDGYYFVKDADGSVTVEGESYSKYMLEVIKDVTIEAKDETLTPEKKILEGDTPTPVDATSAAIGDVITFQVTIPVPKMDGYEKYFFEMNDTLCEGLTFQSITSVKVGDNTLSATTNTTDTGKTYVLGAPTAANGNKLTVTFNNFIQYKGTTGNVVVTYTAILNDKAAIETANKNEVDFTYSNNPAHSGDGEYDDDDYTSQTPKDETETWTTKLEITKIGDGDTSNLLEGAQFTLAGDAINSAIVKGEKFEPSDYEAEDGETIEAGTTYYKLKNGSYTTTPSTTATAAQYEEGDDTYVKVTFEKLVTESQSVTMTATTGADGKISFTGLNAGTYTLTEDVAPNGYNEMDPNPVTIVIEWSEEDGFTVGTSSVSGLTHDATDKQFELTIDDKSGAELPSTGGIGTTIFYVVGSILVLAAGVILVVRRRVSAN